MKPCLPRKRTHSAFQAHYPGADACLRKHRVRHHFQPGPVGFPNHSTLILWRVVPGYRYQLGVRPSGEVLSAAGRVLSQAELLALVAELGARWQRRAQRGDAYLHAVGWLMARQVCFVFGLVAALFAGLSWSEEGAGNAPEIVELLGGGVFFALVGLICRAYRRQAPPVRPPHPS